MDMIMRNRNFLIQLFICFLFFFMGGFYVQSVHAQQRINTDQRIRPQSSLQRAIVPFEMLELVLDTIPNLVGMKYSEDRIRTLLDVHGLELGNSVPVGDNQNVGIVTSQSPFGGTIKTPNPRVDITYGVRVPVGISRPDNVFVPNYVGMTEQRAFGRMPNDRLVRGNRREVNSDVQAGIVVNQFPDARMKVASGTEIHLDISIGPPQEIRIRIPRLVGLNLQHAAEILRKADLFVGNLNEQVSDGREGIIIKQFPRSGTEVVSGSVVDIIYSVRAVEELIPVPDVRILPRDEAILILKESGLNYSIQYEKNTGQSVGVVAHQIPLPGTMVALGKNVTIIVQDNNGFPVYLIIGGLLAMLLGVFLGKKVTARKKRKRISNKNIELKLKLVWDNGKQIVSDNTYPIRNKLNLKYIPDLGKQNLKTK